MFADEKGYLVTEMVWEEVELSEEELHEESSSSLPPKAIASKSASAGGNIHIQPNIEIDDDDADIKIKAKVVKQKEKKAKAVLESGGVQKSISSFFGKK